MPDTPNLDALLNDEQREKFKQNCLMALADQSGEAAYGDFGWITAEHVRGSGWVPSPRPELAIGNAIPLIDEMLKDLAATGEHVEHKHDGIRDVYRYI